MVSAPDVIMVDVELGAGQSSPPTITRGSKLRKAKTNQLDKLNEQLKEQEQVADTATALAVSLRNSDKVIEDQVLATPHPSSHGGSASSDGDHSSSSQVGSIRRGALFSNLETLWQEARTKGAVGQVSLIPTEPRGVRQTLPKAVFIVIFGFLARNNTFMGSSVKLMFLTDPFFY